MKALFDVVYLSGGRSRLFAYLPELELPARFRTNDVRRWIKRIGAPRRRSMVERRVDTILQQADRAGPPKAAGGTRA